MDEVDKEMIYIKTINDISKEYGVSLKDAHLMYSGKSSGLSPEVQKKIKADSLDPNDQIILKELRELRAIVDSEDRTRPSDPPLGPQPKIPAKRKPDKDSTDLNKLIIKLTNKNLSIKGIEAAAKEAFPHLKEDITPAAIRSRKSRLRKKGELP